MPEKYTLTEKELLYASMLSGISNIWGVKDPYAGMHEEEIKMDILRMQKSLLEKGYALSEEDGNFSLQGRLSEILHKCASSRYLCEFISDEFENKNQIRRYYIGTKSLIRLECSAGASLVYVSEDEMINELSALFCAGSESTWTETLIAGSSRLKHFGSISRSRFIQELKDKGCEDSLSVIIANGLQGSSSFRVLLCFDTSSVEPNVPVQKLVTMHFPGGSLIAEADSQSSSDAVRFRKLTKDQLIHELKKITQLVPLKGSDEYAS